jgi:Beta propeller domain
MWRGPFLGRERLGAHRSRRQVRDEYRPDVLGRCLNNSQLHAPDPRKGGETMKPLIALLISVATLAPSSSNGRIGPLVDMPFDTDDQSTRSNKKLRAFRSDQELKDFFKQLAAEQKKRKTTRPRGVYAAGNSAEMAAAPAAAPSAAPSMAADTAITNTQHAGVDEGGIVKLHGDYLVMLRRGRLFSVAIANGQLRPVSAVDAFAPDIDPGGTWYDELMVSGDTVVVIGFSYMRGGTEIGLFDIDRSGGLRYRSTYHLRSNDYYSSRNYSARLIGTSLVFYSPLYVAPETEDPPLPALRRWHPGAGADEFHTIASATRVYRPNYQFNTDNGMALHTVTSCDLARRDLSCDSTVVMGPPGRVFYVSPNSVYVWATGWRSWRAHAATRERAMLYRMPLDGSSPTAVQVSGSPVDQFSFLESEDGHLHVLVRSDAAGDGMWAAEVAQGDVALLRVAVDSFSDGSDAVPASSYRRLPRPEGHTFQNRFVGNYLLYGTGSGWGRPRGDERARVFAVPWSGRELFELPLPHGVDRIEALGSDATVIGTDGRNLHFTAVRLGQQARVADQYVREGASQGELRSHGFFYKPEDGSRGLLGLPIRGAARPGYEHLFRDSASILFLRNESLHFNELGELESRAEKSGNDGCRASCVDWYGNARPLFIAGRVFALLGYELVEGAVRDGRISELRRVSYAPRLLSSR